ncbi:MAG: APC family permease [Bryobacteraceae bacterium]
METRRVIGRWTMTALVVNSIIGSAIFGVPSEVMPGWVPEPECNARRRRIDGDRYIAHRGSRVAVFSPRGLYLYARTAFGRFVGLQVGWFWLLAIVGGGAAAVNLFLNYLDPFLPSISHGWPRVLAIVLLVVVPTTANYVGVRQGALFTVLFTIAKLLPLMTVILVGLFKMPATVSSPMQMSAWTAWPKVLLILIYAFSGWEDTLLPAGEVKTPEVTLPFALISSLLICTVVYTLFQLVIARTVGTAPSKNAVTEAAATLLGGQAVPLVSVAVMLSTFGWLSGAFLNAPRFAVALAEQGDSPVYLGQLHPRFGTPHRGIVLYGIVVFLLASTGSFIWAIELTAGALSIFYSVACLSLFRFRTRESSSHIVRMPFGRGLAAIGVALSLALLTQLEARQLGLMSLTCPLGIANWAWARRPKGATDLFTLA